MANKWLFFWIFYEMKGNKPMPINTLFIQFEHYMVRIFIFPFKNKNFSVFISPKFSHIADLIPLKSNNILPNFIFHFHSLKNPIFQCGRRRTAKQDFV